MKVVWTPVLECSKEGLEALITKRCKEGLYLIHSPTLERRDIIRGVNWQNVDLEAVVGVLSDPRFDGKEVTFEFKPTRGGNFSLRNNDPTQLLLDGLPVKLCLRAVIHQGKVIQVICYNLIPKTH